MPDTTTDITTTMPTTRPVTTTIPNTTTIPDTTTPDAEYTGYKSTELYTLLQSTFYIPKQSISGKNESTNHIFVSPTSIHNFVSTTSIMLISTTLESNSNYTVYIIPTCLLITLILVCLIFWGVKYRMNRISVLSFDTESFELSNRNLSFDTESFELSNRNLQSL